MVSIATFKQIALSFDGTEQHPHFDRTAFKVVGKRTFATLHEPTQTANIVLSVEDQAVYSAYEEGGVYPVPNKWGLKGWTTFELSQLPIELVSDALYTAYKAVVESKRRKK